MQTIKNILLERLKHAEQNPEVLQQFYKNQSKQDNKKYNDAVQCFQKRLNRDRKHCGLKDVPFIAVRMKLYALKEITDLRWFWIVCTKYSNTYRKEKDIKGKPIRNTFSGCFFGALK